MRKKILFSKLDKILLPMLRMHESINPRRIFLSVFDSVNKIVQDANQQKSVFLRIFFKVLFAIIGFIIAAPVTVLFFMVYLVVAAITSVIATIVILVLSLVYGLLPFLIKCDIPIESEKREKIIYKGYHKLRYPITWSVSFISENRSGIFRLGSLPVLKINQLNSDGSETHIIDRITLAVACIYSYTLYFGLTLIIMQLLSYIAVLVIGGIFGILFILIDIIIKFSNNEVGVDDNQEENIEENVKGEKND